MGKEIYLLCFLNNSVSSCICRLFEKYPDMQQIFIPFRGLTAEELRNCDKLRQHGLRVMGTVDKCVARIDKLEKLEKLLHELGNKHVVFNIKTDYLDVSMINFH